MRIVGVVPTVRQRGGFDPDPVVYLPARAVAPPTMAIVARSSGDPAALTAPLREALARIDPNLALYRVMTLERAMHDARWNPRMATVLLRSLVLIGAILALVGLYAVTAHAVGQRRRELAVLAALGARPGELRKVVLRPTMIQLAAGLVLGVGCAYPLNDLFNGNHPIAMTDAATLVPLIAAIVIVAAIACLVPARQAARVDPIVALRHE
jgi:putative ABC transport system permease protein